MLKDNVYFFIGTEAELIKVFTVIIECQKNGSICHIIASGQNDLKRSRILEEICLEGKYIELSSEADIKKSAAGLLGWFITTLFRAKRNIYSHFTKEMINGKRLVVHGDTVSTLMGAIIGKLLKMEVCHVEAGLRSHNWLNPFPEEIDRMLTSRLARIHFAPGEEPTKNLVNVKGQVVDTKLNTIFDSLLYSQTMPIATKQLDEIMQNDYFVFVMHRQENLMNKEFVKQVVDRITKIAENKKCILVLHKITENTLSEMGLLENLKSNPNFILVPRVDYFDFMKLLNGASYVMTDGGSNQEELCYMGKPCLILRNTTERKEGIGENAVMFNGDVEQILNFADIYERHKTDGVKAEQRPSKIIADCICGRNLQS